MQLGELWSNESELVFCCEDGSPVHPDRFKRAFKRKVEAVGLPDLRGPQALRHTWATLALQSGIHPKFVSDRLGHSTIHITLDTYSHAVPGLDDDAANTVADRIKLKRMVIPRLKSISRRSRSSQGHPARRRTGARLVV